MIRALAMIVLRDWRMHKLRLALTTAGIALGVAAFFAIQTANETLVGSLNGTIEKLAGKATLQVTAGETSFAMDTLKVVKASPGVAMAEPVTETLISTPLGGGTRMLIMGLDTASDLNLYKTSPDQGNLIVKNPLAFSNRKDSVAVTRVFADRFGLADGDKFTVEAQTGPIELTVRGVFDSSGIGDVYDGNVAVMDIYSAQDVFGRGNKIDRIDISNANDVDIDKLQQTLAAKVGGLEVVRPNLRGKSLENSVTTMRAGFTIMSILALTIGVFIIFNSFTISVNQRWKEIAVLRSIGVERHGIRLMFLAESVILGLVGSSVGIACGLLVAQVAMSAIVGMTAKIYGFESSPGVIEFDIGFAAGAFALGLVASLIAAWLPANSAASLEPASALRNIETRQPDVRSSRLRIVLGFVLIIGGLLLTRFTPPTVGSYIQTTYSFAIQLGMILLLPKIIEIGAIVLRPLMSLLFGIEGVIAVETMARAPRRTVATVGAIMIGLTFALSNASLVQSQKIAINRSIDKAIAADVLVTTSEQLHSRTYHFTESTAEKVSSLPEIEVADQVRVTATDFDGLEVTILAHDMGAYFDISPDLLDHGDAAAAREITKNGKGILISNNLSFRWNVKLGDKIPIRSPKGEIALPVVGMLDYYRSENGTIFMDRELYKQYWDDTDVDYVFINLKPGIDRQAFKNKVQAAIAGTQRAFIYTHEEYKAWVMQLIDQFFMLMYMQIVVAVLVAAIGLINTMLISVVERRREIGIFRAIGGLRSQVIKMVLLEAIAISVIGFAAGAVTGLMNSYFLIKTAARVVAGFDLPFHFPYLLVAGAIPSVIIVALFSAWLPARNAARLQVADAIGYE
ncbi:MAG: FtsX-like permease family protein [Pyrinomonadaceae bacterium]